MVLTLLKFFFGSIDVPFLLVGEANVTADPVNSFIRTTQFPPTGEKSPCLDESTTQKCFHPQRPHRPMSGSYLEVGYKSIEPLDYNVPIKNMYFFLNQFRHIFASYIITITQKTNSSNPLCIATTRRSYYLHHFPSHRYKARNSR